ncbi:3' terminal RNA ribose 2'-O-methyltransferase Hen1 [Nocardiopsis halophila]|uniref:3' terminal RNA ribose 2'-O-methyltransferase Hen1 n=1 Tax=Nocardiopsis halophila TaxID=141692 RepID=UPI0003469172|nr:3' terminal RNA ribose 2'-O-methyltransferase Hen1 [Nocardiopsis halophila]
MLLTITARFRPATDLGYLLHKHPDRVQSFAQAHGTAHVFYPEAGPEACTAALLLEVDPDRLRRARPHAGAASFALASYVNDRPYAASSLMSVAIGDVFRTALKGRCDARPDLAAAALPLTLSLPAVPCRGGADEARALFEPLGWRVEAEPVPLDEGLPGWGDAHYIGLTLTGERRLSEALSHLYVLLPVMDGAKHYWVADDEVDKLLRNAGGWLAGHPERPRITSRYLARRRHLARQASARLDALGALEDLPEHEPPERPPEEEAREREPTLADRRAGAVLSALKAEGARTVLDLGCGAGALVRRLLDDAAFTRVAGADPSADAVAAAHRRLRTDRMSERESARLELFCASAVHRDPRLRGYDAAVLMEVVEHLDPWRLPALEHVVFGDAAPRTVVVTTPNAEYNVHYPGLAQGRMRHPDHRFEWTRAAFAAWAERVAAEHGYRVRLLPVGPEDTATGPPTQMGVFTR